MQFSLFPSICSLHFLSSSLSFFFPFFPLRLWCLPITKSSSGLSSQIGRIKFGSARLNTLWMKEQQQQQQQQQQSLVHQRLANHHRSNRWNANWQIKLESTEHRTGGGGGKWVESTVQTDRQNGRTAVCRFVCSLSFFPFCLYLPGRCHFYYNDSIATTHTLLLTSSLATLSGASDCDSLWAGKKSPKEAASTHSLTHSPTLAILFFSSSSISGAALFLQIFALFLFSMSQQFSKCADWSMVFSSFSQLASLPVCLPACLLVPFHLAFPLMANAAQQTVRQTLAGADGRWSCWCCCNMAQMAPIWLASFVRAKSRLQIGHPRQLAC